MNATVKTLIILLALLLPALLLGLGDRPVYKIQEVRIAETAREMLASGDWAVPRYNGELRLQKPPLPYWLTGLSFGAGGIDATRARLPAAVFGLLTGLLLFRWSRRELGGQAAASVILVCVASYIGLRYFRSGEADAILLFFISAACLLGFDLLRRSGDGLRRALFGLVLGLGFLTKGPAALAIPLLTLAGIALLDRRAGRPLPAWRALFSMPGVLLLLLAAFGWYAWILWKLPNAAEHFVGKQVDETFVSGTHAKPAWWYLAHWVEFFAPWGILLLPAGVMAWVRRRGQPLPDVLRFAWVWLGVVFVLLTFTVNKQMQYALLFLPPLAIILGHYLTESRGRFALVNRALFGLFCALVLAGGVYALVRLHAGASLLPWLALAVVPLALKRMLRAEHPSAAVLLVAGLMVSMQLFSDAHLSKEPRKVAAQTLVASASGDIPLYQFRPADGALSFYAGRVVPPVEDEDLPALLRRQPELWLITPRVPQIAGYSVDVVKTSDELKLCRIKRLP